jgi:hypothetical protein
MLAVIAGHVAIVRLLVRAGADLTLRGRGAPGFMGKTAYDLGRCPTLSLNCSSVSTQAIVRRISCRAGGFILPALLAA